MAHYGEFSDYKAEALEDDPDIEVLDVKDGEFGLDQGTKFVEFRVRKE